MLTPTFNSGKSRHRPSKSELRDEVKTVRCCKSRHVNDGLASSAKANTPAASGAAAEVPE